VRPLRGGFDGWKEAGFPLVDYEVDTPASAVLPVDIKPAPQEPKPALPLL
jgi:hypothetical protein